VSAGPWAASCADPHALNGPGARPSRSACPQRGSARRSPRGSR
jgi:hypothetical protein